MLHGIRGSTEYTYLPGLHRYAGVSAVLNKKVVEFALKAGTAANCQINQYFANLTERIISIQITRRTIRFLSCICQSVMMAG